jgi:hypothetical protein
MPLRPTCLPMARTAPGVAAQATTKPERKNWFDDPFFQAASGMRTCPAPEGPLFTAEERRAQMHSRLERGTSCWLAGRCSDSNAYAYDRPLAPKVEAALAAVPGAWRGSVWVVIQRRWVYLQGCVPSREPSLRLEQAVRAVPDVELVLPQLMIGTRGKPPYAAVAP